MSKRKDKGKGKGKIEDVEFKIYSNNDLIKIDEQMCDIQQKSKKRQLELLEPTGEEYSDVFKYLLKFIKEKKRIIYGGYAQHIYLKKKGDKIYEEYDTPDIEFYSYEPIKDLIEFADFLHKKGFKNINVKNAHHSETYTLFVNFKATCDATYVPKILFNKLPVESVSKIQFIGTNIIYIDMLIMMNDPLTSYWRLEKTFPRFSKFSSNYSLKIKKIETLKKYNIELKNKNNRNKNNRNKNNANKNNTNKNNANSDKIFRNDLIKFIGSDIILNNLNTLIGVGYYAHYFFHSQCQESIDKVNKNNLYIPYIEVISINFDEDVKNIYNQIIDKYGKERVSYNEYFPFFQYHDNSIEFMVDGIKCIHIYGNNEKCIPFITINTHNIKMAQFSYNIYFLLTKYYKAITQNDLLEIDNSMSMIYRLFTFRKIMLKDKSIMDSNHIFREFQIDCMGDTVMESRKYFKRLNERKNLNKMVNYNPEKTTEDGRNKQQNITYDNRSGNKIINGRLKLK